MWELFMLLILMVQSNFCDVHDFLFNFQCIFIMFYFIVLILNKFMVLCRPLHFKWVRSLVKIWHLFYQRLCSRELKYVCWLVLSLVVFPLVCSFCPTAEGSENDMRFVYCACCISYILDDWGGIDQDRVLQYIKTSLVGTAQYSQTRS